jgi:hypothetical protein
LGIRFVGVGVILGLGDGVKVAVGVEVGIGEVVGIGEGVRVGIGVEVEIGVVVGGGELDRSLNSTESI